jgi:endonuclease YncB( thermonuclease family)
MSVIYAMLGSAAAALAPHHPNWVALLFMDWLLVSQLQKIGPAGGPRQLRVIALGLLLAATGLGAPALADSKLTSRGIRVIDGDTIALGDQRIRLWGIDAPEIRQECIRDGASYPCGRAAKAFLEALVGSESVACGEVAQDRHRRSVARCWASGGDIGEAVIRAGWALDYSRYSRGFYSSAERGAQLGMAGMWNGVFETPWAWRHRAVK